MAPMVKLFWSFSLVFINCELPGRIGNQFDDIEYLINQFKWYLFPYDVQKILPFVILNAQELVGFECFGAITKLLNRFDCQSLDYEIMNEFDYEVCDI